MAGQYQTVSVIEAAMRKTLVGKTKKNEMVYRFADGRYYLPTLQEFSLFLQREKVQLLNRDPLRGTEGFDCDDFSFALKGKVALYNRNQSRKMHSWSMGIIWGRFSWINEDHACNWVMLRDGSLRLVEPQNNRLYTFNHCTGKVQLILL